MSGTRWMSIATLLLLWAAPMLAAELSPEETVRKYLVAFKEGNFRAAYPFVSKHMAQNKTEEDWAKEQQWIMQMAEAKVFDFKVFPGKVEGEKAFVPNVLNSQDKFLNQLGVVEHELYTLVKEDGRWKINQQQIVEPGDVGKWFPSESAGSKSE